MTWFKSDDGFPEHPKSDALAEHFGADWPTLNLAFATWHHMGCDCASRGTDGVFSSARAYRVMRAPREAIDAAVAGLLAVGLLEATEGAFVFHDWHHYQPSNVEVTAKREEVSRKRAEAGRKGGRKSGEARAATKQNEANRKQTGSKPGKQNEASGQANVETKHAANALSVGDRSKTEASGRSNDEAPSRPVQYRRESQTRARAPDPPTDPIIAPPPEPVAEPRCPTVEPAASPSAASDPDATDPAEVLAKLRVASQGLVADPNVASAGELIAVKRAVDALRSRGVTLDAIVRSARHLAHGHWTQRSKRTVITAGRLVEERAGRGSILGELLAELDGCEQCRPVAPKRTPSTPLRIVEPSPISEAEAAAKRSLLARALGGERVLV